MICDLSKYSGQTLLPRLVDMQDQQGWPWEGLFLTLSKSQERWRWMARAPGVENEVVVVVY